MSTWTKGLQTPEVSIPWAWEEVVTRQKVQITKGSAFWSEKMVNKKKDF